MQSGHAAVPDCRGACAPRNDGGSGTAPLGWLFSVGFLLYLMENGWRTGLWDQDRFADGLTGFEVAVGLGDLLECELRGQIPFISFALATVCQRTNPVSGGRKGLCPPFQSFEETIYVSRSPFNRYDTPSGFPDSRSLNR